MKNFSQEEVFAAKQVRNAIINSDAEELKSIYMAGEICMWDELQQKYLKLIKEETEPNI